jgi:hypothetical protein
VEDDISSYSCGCCAFARIRFIVRYTHSRRDQSELIDAEIFCLVVQFVNRMVIGVSEVNHHALLRSELNAVLIGESYDQAVVQLDQELQQLARIEHEAQEIGEAGSYMDGLFGRASRSASAASGYSMSSVMSSKSTSSKSAAESVKTGTTSAAPVTVTTSALTPAPNSSPPPMSAGIAGTGAPPVSSGKAPPRGLKRLSMSLMGLGSGRDTSAPSTVEPSAAAALMRSSSANVVSGSGKGAPETEVHVDKALTARRVSHLRSKSIKSLHGPRAISEQRVEAILRNPNALMSISERDPSTLSNEALDGIEIDAKVGGHIEHYSVNPLMGTMAGVLTASKNTEKMEHVLVDLWGGKKTKRRWYEVDGESFKWCAGHEKENEYKGSVPVNAITDIRNHTTDQNLLATNPHSFEFETAERVFALGCETAEEKEHWVTALQVGRDNSIIGKGSYRSHMHELTTKDLHKFAAMFKKQGLVFHSIAVEDRRTAMTNMGLDLTDPKAVMEYLRLEVLAAGNTDLLLAVCQQLLLIPQSARGTWQAALAGIKVRYYREYCVRAVVRGLHGLSWLERSLLLAHHR